MKNRTRVELGRSGEKAALRYLHDRGYVLVKSNFRTRRGEADLVLRQGETLVFCEVKTRRSDATGHAAESYTPQQQRRLRKTVLSYLQKTDWTGPVRVDVLALQKLPDSPHFEVHHFEDALSLEDNW